MFVFYKISSSFLNKNECFIFQIALTFVVGESDGWIKFEMSKMTQNSNIFAYHFHFLFLCLNPHLETYIHTCTHTQQMLKRTKLCVVVKHQTCGDPHHHMSIYRATMKCPLGRKERNLVSLKVLK